jgi:prepilin-type N-terminal cleavage/methylation domain-containing protein
MKFFFSTHNKKTHSGFTLMEIMVAVSIFTIIMVTGISSLLIINTTNAKSRAERQAVDQASFILESMSRKMRTAQSLTVGGNSSVTFVNQKDETESYLFTPGTPGGTLKYQLTPLGGSVQEYTLSDGQNPQGAILFRNISFEVLGNDAADGHQPIVVVRASGTAQEGKQSVSFSVQTAVSPRILQLEATQ